MKEKIDWKEEYITSRGIARYLHLTDTNVKFGTPGTYDVTVEYEPEDEKALVEHLMMLYDAAYALHRKKEFTTECAEYLKYF